MRYRSQLGRIPCSRRTRASPNAIGWREPAPDPYGRGEIRTPETGVARLPVFKTGAFNRSATLPWLHGKANGLRRQDPRPGVIGATKKSPPELASQTRAITFHVLLALRRVLAPSDPIGLQPIRIKPSEGAGKRRGKGARSLLRAIACEHSGSTYTVNGRNWDCAREVRNEFAVTRWPPRSGPSHDPRFVQRRSPSVRRRVSGCSPRPMWVS
jgi:hypothetical protein